MNWINQKFWNAWKQSNTSSSKNSKSRYLGSKIEREEKWEEYHIRCSSDENNVEDGKEEEIGVGGALVAPRCGVPIAAAEVDEPLRFLDDSSIWWSYWRFWSIGMKENLKWWKMGFCGRWFGWEMKEIWQIEDWGRECAIEGKNCENEAVEDSYL